MKKYKKKMDECKVPLFTRISFELSEEQFENNPTFLLAGYDNQELTRYAIYKLAVKHGVEVSSLILMLSVLDNAEAVCLDCKEKEMANTFKHMGKTLNHVLEKQESLGNILEIKDFVCFVNESNEELSPLMQVFLIAFDCAFSCN